MADRDKLKQAAAEAAMAFLPASGIVGLGTGSTARHAIRLMAERIAGDGAGLVGVATSRASAQAAAKAGIPLSFRPCERIQYNSASLQAVDAVSSGGGFGLIPRPICSLARPGGFWTAPSNA